MKKNGEQKPAMENELTPQAVREAAFERLMSLNAFLKMANVAPATFYTWEHGQNPRPLTLAKLRRAVESNP
jgi:uncharacterized protein YtpQ (UPF0354 family)